MFIYLFHFLFTGPNFWGLLNLEWSLCNKGKNQSPINIDPGTLLFDPQLENLKIDGNMVSKDLYHYLSDT